MSFAENKRLYLLGGIGLLVLLVLYLVTRSPGTEDPDPALAKIDRMERKKDSAGLAQAVSDPNEKVAGRAMLALANVDGTTAREKFEPLLNDPRPQVQRTAVRLYGRVADRQNPSPLIQLYRSAKDPELKAAAATALGEARSWDAVEVLLPSMNDPNPLVRRAAADAVGKIVGVDLNFDSSAAPATRQKVLAQLRQNLPNLKKAYDEYWNRNPR